MLSITKLQKIWYRILYHMYNLGYNYFFRIYILDK